MRYALILSVIILGALTYIYFGQSQEVHITNEMCPVMPDEPIDPAISVEYQGQEIFLCCKRCVKKFNENPEKYASQVESSYQKKIISSSRRWAIFIGKLHPMGVHFPIALFFSAIIAQVLLWKTKNELFLVGHRFCLCLAAITSIVAMALGWTAYLTSDYKGALTTIMEYHKLAGSLVCLLLIITALLNEKCIKAPNKKLQYSFFFFMVITTIAISITGFWGSTLIHGLGHYNW